MPAVKRYRAQGSAHHYEAHRPSTDAVDTPSMPHAMPYHYWELPSHRVDGARDAPMLMLRAARCRLCAAIIYRHRHAPCQSRATGNMRVRPRRTMI